MASNRASKNKLVAKVVDGESGACAFCRKDINDEIAFGKLYSIGDLYCHYFCVLLSCCLVQKGQDEHGLLGFLYTDIQAEIERSKKHKCSYCGQEGATLGCAVVQCRKQFHLPCGRQRQSVSLFYGNYKSFCNLHAPRQKIAPNVLEKMKQRMQCAGKHAATKAVMSIVGGIDTAQAEDEDADVCVICYEPVLPGTQWFWPPCCARDARFHRPCLERMALSAGIHYLKCPLCNDKDTFYRAVVAQGYYVPDRDAAWELEQGAFADIYNREVSCNADVCVCPLGRGHDTDHGDWDMKLCLLCGSSGVHPGCLPAAAAGSYVCASCQPAAPTPAELAQLEERILKIQEEEQQRVAQASQSRRVMPSRMSLRRSKGAVVSTSRNWRSESTSATLPEDREEYSVTAASRSQLNLKTPRRVPRTDKTTPDNSLDDTLSCPLKYLRLRLAAARAHLDDEMADKLRRRFKKPCPLSQKRRIVNAILNEILLEGHIMRSPLKEWNTPKKWNTTPTKNEKPIADTRSSPLLSPKQTVTRDDVTPSPKWTPSKSSVGNAEPQAARLANCEEPSNAVPLNIAESEDSDDTYYSALLLFNGTAERTPKKIRNAMDNAEKCDESSNSAFLLKNETPKLTPKESPASETAAATQNTAENNESSNRASPLTNKTPTLTPKKSPKTITATQNSPENDESSNSTFQLPSDFVAEHISDDELLGFDNPNKYCITVQMEKDSSMEISNEEAKINIDLKKIDSEEETTKILKGVYVKSPERTVKCSYKFSPTDKEALETADVGIDVESFKSQYLNEVEQDVKSCAYSHKHDNKDAGVNRLKTPIDYALEAFKKKLLEAAKRQINADATQGASDNDAEENINETDKEVKEKTNRASVIGPKKRNKRYSNRDYINKKRAKNRKPRRCEEEKSSSEQKAEIDDKTLDGSVTSLKRKKCDKSGPSLKTPARDAVSCAKKPKLDLRPDAKSRKIHKSKAKKRDTANVNTAVEDKTKHTLDKKYNENVASKMSNNIDDDFETKKRPNKENKKRRSKEERRLRKLNKKQKKDGRYLVKCKKRQSSVKIKLVYNESDATDENCINLTLKSKKEKKKMKHKRSMMDKHINLKIKFKTEQKKRKKIKKTLSPNTLRQTVLNFSPENISTNFLVRPIENVTPMKKRIYIKKELSTDSLKQTSIQSFFNKIQSTVKEDSLGLSFTD